MKHGEFYLNIGEINEAKQPPTVYPPWRQVPDCDLVRQRSMDSRLMVCLKLYNEKDFHPDDLKVIKRHKIKHTADLAPFYEFTNERTFEEIKNEKERMLQQGGWKFDNDSIFSMGKRRVHIPEHYEEHTIYWDCDGDSWKEDITGEV